MPRKLLNGLAKKERFRSELELSVKKVERRREWKAGDGGYVG
jgi:hypothetical protein